MKYDVGQRLATEVVQLVVEVVGLSRSEIIFINNQAEPATSVLWGSQLRLQAWLNQDVVRRPAIEVVIACG